MRGKEKEKKYAGLLREVLLCLQGCSYLVAYYTGCRVEFSKKAYSQLVSTQAPWPLRGLAKKIRLLRQRKRGNGFLFCEKACKSEGLKNE
jgi:hypothetical protein